MPGASAERMAEIRAVRKNSNKKDIVKKRKEYSYINGTGLFGVDYQLTNIVNNLANNIFYTSNLSRKNKIFTSNNILETSNVKR
jgi:hypothetical protein